MADYDLRGPANAPSNEFVDCRLIHLSVTEGEQGQSQRRRREAARGRADRLARRARLRDRATCQIRVPRWLCPVNVRILTLAAALLELYLLRLFQKCRSFTGLSIHTG